MEGLFDIDAIDILSDKLVDWSRFRRHISGTYKNKNPASDNSILELRVDVDGRRPQERISGDVFKQRGLRLIDDFILTPNQQLLDSSLWPFFYKSYDHSFVVEEITQTEDSGAAVLTGPIIYYNDPTRTNETIEVRIKRVAYMSKAPDAVAYIYRSGKLIKSYCLPKISEFFREVTLEIDRFQGTSFPSDVNTDIDPSPSDLTVQTLSTSSIFRKAGICLTVDEDEVLSDSDSSDPGSNWSEAELHDLMEDRFDLFANKLQWNTYGIVVPRFGDPDYNSSYYGTMFDWGGWQTGDTYFRQGCAIAEDATRGRQMGTLYDTNAKRDRLVLQTFCHEIGHSFNLPHSWSRSDSPDSASESFMNYPWGYTGGGSESGFWSDFRWEFDDVELIWMRHQDRNDVIFGGNDWIGNNLSIHVEPEAEISGAPLLLELNSPGLVDFAEPIRLDLALTNSSKTTKLVVDRLDPEDNFVTLYIRRPNGQFVRYVPPVWRLKSPGDLVELAPGDSISRSVLVSFSAKGLEFQEPGEYLVRACYGRDEDAAIISRALRLRVATPKSREDEELAYLMFGRDAAKFLYFNGSERRPEINSQLEEAVLKYEKTNPRVVRQIQAALGINSSRKFKRVETKKNRRVVVARMPDLQGAVAHLKGALAMPPETNQPAVSDTRYVYLTDKLALTQVQFGKKADAKKTLDAAARYLKMRKADSRHIDTLNKRLKSVSSATKQKKR